MTFLNRKNKVIFSLAIIAIILTIVTAAPLRYPTNAFAINNNINNAMAVQLAGSTSDSSIGHDQSLKYSIGQHYQVIPAALVQVLQNRAESMGTLKHFTLVATSDNGHMKLPTGDPINLMTFNGSFPAPTLRVTQGDVVQVTVINKDTEIHSVDF
ncbi:MAG: multicopper oxidase domain-containing protein, partial [Candidatus Eiseniibacteriota bacterium]